MHLYKIKGVFRMNNKKVTSIEIKNESSGLCSVDEIIAETLKIYRTGKIKHLQYNGLSDKPIKEYEYNVKVTGTVEPPPRGNQLKAQIFKLTAFQVEPWIL
jgi:hypothetical protein